MMFPATIGSFIQIDWVQRVSAAMSPGTVYYYICYIAMIVFFCFFYTAIVFNPKETADNLRKSGAYLPGIRPGAQTARHIDSIMGRLTLAGAMYITAVCLLPEFLILYWNVPFYFGGTSVLILVGVALDTTSKIETYLLTKNYEGFMKHTRVRGRSTAT